MKTNLETPRTGEYWAQEQMGPRAGGQQRSGEAIGGREPAQAWERSTEAPDPQLHLMHKVLLGHCKLDLILS